MWLRIALAGYRFKCTDEILSYYRRHGTNTTSNIRLLRSGWLEVLRRIYSVYQLPAGVAGRQPKAYRDAYAFFAREELACGDSAAAADDLALLFRTEREAVRAIETYYELDCATQPPWYRGTSSLIDPQRISEPMLDVVSHALSTGDQKLISREERSRAIGLAWLALGSVAYNHVEDLRVCRRFLVRALRSSPRLLANSRLARLSLRACAGRRMVERAKELRAFLMHILAPDTRRLGLP
jgi:hypothetical protein